MANYGYDEIWAALEELVKLNNHYARLLNKRDDGERTPFADAKEYLDRLRQLEKTKK